MPDCTGDHSERVERFFLEDGSDVAHQYYRRPGIVSNAGTLIAYYEGQCVVGEKRQTLFCRISTDAGARWSPRIVLAEGGGAGMLHNLMMVYSAGKYHCLWNVQYRQLWYRSSADGRHWSAPRDLTRMVWRADCDYPWNAFGIGSGHGIELDGGRILIPAWFTVGGDSHKPSAFGNIYTDDCFETLKIGEVLASGDRITNPNEGAVVQLKHGDVLATVRHDDEVRARAFCVSRGGVDAWRDVAFRGDLPDPICHASMLRVKSEASGDYLLFCNCANPDPDWKRKREAGLSRYLWSDDARKNLVLRASCDGGAHFSGGVCLSEQAGYSDLACVDDTVVCLYETGWNMEETCVFPRQLAVSRVPLERVCQGIVGAER